MKVQNINHSLPDSGIRPVREEAVQQSSGSMPFQRHMTDLSEARYQSYIQQLVGTIAEQGERMAKRADLSEFHRYREMIRKLLDETVSNGFAFKKYRKFDMRGKNKTFAVIQCINDKLDEILQALLAEEADHLALLSTVDDIRGMLVDLML